jgi:L-rhamnose mutarotase
VQASHNKVWPDSVAILPSGAIDNNKIHIRNIRDFKLGFTGSKKKSERI